MVKTGRHIVVQVIKVNTVSGGVIRPPVPPDVMYWEEHSIISVVFLQGIHGLNP